MNCGAVLSMPGGKRSPRVIKITMNSAAEMPAATGKSASVL
jgi:hypothetical protein